MHEPRAEPGDLILQVDDDPETRLLIGDFLVQHGFRVSTAANGAEMVREMEADPPAFDLLDLMLPGDEGLAICRRLSAAGRIPVIMLSGLGAEMERIVGAIDALAKGRRIRGSKREKLPALY